MIKITSIGEYKTSAKFFESISLSSSISGYFFSYKTFFYNMILTYEI